MTLAAQDTPSTRPYLIRALYEWCTENGFSPYLAVQVDASVRVPMDHVKNGEIVLNISFDATSGMQLGNEFIEFKARFGGVAREIHSGEPRHGHLRTRKWPRYGVSSARGPSASALTGLFGGRSQPIRCWGWRADHCPGWGA
ncbi:MAG: hypothetical protein RJA56_456 [Pseudomonadota bacterium]